MPQTIQVAQVIGHAPEQHGLLVMLPSGQFITNPIRVLKSGPCDGLRIHQTALPGRGTWGLVLFPYDDDRNGVWIGAFEANLIDAITTTAGEPFTEYSAHWSGAWELMQDDGEWCKSFPDGTYVVVASGTIKPTTYRHIVNPDQTQSRVVFTDADRIPTPPSPWYYRIQHATGSYIEIDPSGNVSVISPGGNVDVQAGGTCTITVTGATTINSTGNITATSQGNVDITATGTAAVTSSASASVTAPAITLGASGQTLQTIVLGSFESIFNNHTHSDPQGGTTGVPSTPMGGSNLSSTVTAG